VAAATVSAYISAMSVVVRFAPSPTGFLHIGGARTALFNWLFARHHQLHGDGGIFRLRIEDTDRLRSTEEAVAAIVDGLRWLGLTWDGEIVHQAERAVRHAEIAGQLLAAGRAYHCYCTPAELEAMREQARAEKRSVRIDSPWRERDPAEAPPGIAPVIRLKAPQEGATAIHDLVLGDVSVDNQELDDLIILRSDGTPTYNLSVVVDDHDMGVTHVIRGGEHFRNAFRQTQIYRALDWPVPEFAHIPLIHGSDGSKLSKRHGALGIEAYREMGYLPEALRSYLVRLGWSHGDDEIITTDQAILWFDLAGVGRAPAQFDFAKLDSINAHYIREARDARLVGLVADRLEGEFGRPLATMERERLLTAMPGLKPRAKTIVELAEKARFYVQPRPIHPAPDAAKVLTPDARQLLRELSPWLTIQVLASAMPPPSLTDPGTWEHLNLEQRVRMFADARGLKLGAVAQPLRAALTGSLASPGIFEVMEALGRDESLGRIADAAQEEG
jgi:glutamyl-tRNA synthetase